MRTKQESETLATANFLQPITNRAESGGFVPPADGWFHVVPKGRFLHPETGTLQIIDDAALRSIENRFQSEAAAGGKNFPGLLVDFDHFSYDATRPSEAAGWLTAVENRADGLYGRIRWSDRGEEAIRNGRYRFVSPVWRHSDTETVDGPGDKTTGSGPAVAKKMRPLRLDTLALTNSPNLRGMAPLSNRRAAGDFFHENANHPSNPNAQPTQKSMKSIASLLGLSPEASEEAIHGEVARLANRAAQAESAQAPLKNRVTELERANGELLAAQVETDLELHQDRFPSGQRDHWKTQLLANRAAILPLLSGLPKISSSAAPASGASARSGPAPARIHHRQTAGNPGERLAREALGEAGVIAMTGGPAHAAAIRNRASELQAANKKLSYEQAWRLARTELAAELEETAT